MASNKYCSDVGRAKIQRLFAVREAAPGVIAYPKAEHFITLAGDAAASQSPEYTDSPEKLGTRDVLDQYKNAMPAATANASMVLRVGATGTKPQGHDMLETLFGESTFDDPPSFMAGPLLVGETSLIISNVSGTLPPVGVFQLENELIFYSGKSADGATLTGLVRGFDRTTPTAHSGGLPAVYKSTVYMQADCNPSVTLWLQTDHFIQAITGATVNEASISLSNDGPVLVDFSTIQGMQMVMAGTSAMTVTATAGSTVLDVDAPKMFTEKALIWNPSVSDSGSYGEGYKVVSVDYDAGTLTLDKPIAEDWPAETTVTGFLPQDVAPSGEPIEGTDTDVYLDGQPGALRSSSLTYNNDITYITDELGQKYPRSYVEGPRTIQLEMDSYFRKKDAVRFVEGYEGAETSARIDFNHGKVMLYMPRVKNTMPTVNIETPTVSLKSTGTALGSGNGNNAIYLLIN